MQEKQNKGIKSSKIADYHSEYVKNYVIQKMVKFNVKTEPMLVDWIGSLEIPFQTYVKRLICDDMNKKKQETEYDMLPL